MEPVTAVNQSEHNAEALRRQWTKSEIESRNQASRNAHRIPSYPDDDDGQRDSINSSIGAATYC